MYVSPLLFTSTGADVFINAVLINHGTPRHSISNTLDPTMLAIAISPLPATQKGTLLRCADQYCILLMRCIGKNTGYFFVSWFWKIVVLELKSVFFILEWDRLTFI